MDFGIGTTGPGQLHYGHFYKKEELDLEAVILRPASRVANKFVYEKPTEIRRSEKLHAERDARMTRFEELVRQKETYENIKAELGVADSTLASYSRELGLENVFVEIRDKYFY